jgi:hypothetical protein
VLVFVLLLQPLLVNVRVRVLLAVVLMLVFVFHMLVIVRAVSMGVGLVPMTVLMAVRMVVLVVHRASWFESGRGYI